MQWIYQCSCNTLPHEIRMQLGKSQNIFTEPVPYLKLEQSFLQQLVQNEGLLGISFQLLLLQYTEHKLTCMEMRILSCGIQVNT
jgi:hypothetical protein